MSNPLTRPLLALLATLGLATSAQATVVGGFEAGFDGFATVGDVYRVDDSFGAGIPQGNWGLFMSTFPNGAGLLGPLTGTPIDQTATPAVPVGTLETFLGLTGGDLDAASPTGAVVEGSAAQVAFTTTATMTLRLEVILLTNETDAWAPAYTDFFFTTLTGEGVVERTNVLDPLVASPGTVFDRDTGWLLVEWVDLAPGTYTLGVGIVDVLDSDLGTAVIVDNIELVPELRVALMLFAGLGGIWIAGSPHRGPRTPRR
ncbi:MAG: hypothetical protein JRH10_12525 [Deltaproteobacteria bacterium]|nr:hypothetical protein [Deltaproteobacteria bacterium]